MTTKAIRCRRGHKIRAGQIACAVCAHIASVLQKREVWRRMDEQEFQKITAGWRELWVDHAADGTLHFAFHFALGCLNVAFCGAGMGIQPQWGLLLQGKGNANPVYPFDDPRCCLLCLDRIRNNGGGICASVCTGCGGPDGGHKRGCALYLPAKVEAEWSREGSGKQ